MVTTESVTIKVPVGMSKYLVTMNPETELTRNALLLYPYILNQTISHGHIKIGISQLIIQINQLGFSDSQNFCCSSVGNGLICYIRI